MPTTLGNARDARWKRGGETVDLVKCEPPLTLQLTLAN